MSIYNPFLLFVCSQALIKHPVVRGLWYSERILLAMSLFGSTDIPVSPGGITHKFIFSEDI